MSEQKEKTIFYFQFKQDFFDSLEIKDVMGLAEEEGDNPNDYVTLYLKMISKSLSTEGYLSHPSDQILSPGSLRRLLDFKTSLSIKETIDIVDRAIQRFINSNLIYLVNNQKTIFIPQVKYLVMNKKESSESIRLWRMKKEALDKDVKKQQNKNIDEDDELAAAIELAFCGLVNRGFFELGQRESFSSYLEKLCSEENWFPKDVKQGTDIFLKNIEGKDIRNISDHYNYFKVSMKKIIEETIPLLVAEEYKKEEQRKLVEIARYNWVKTKDGEN